MTVPICPRDKKDVIKVWETSGGNEVAEIKTAGNDNYATLWLWRPEDLISKACERLTQNLSAIEWQDYLGDMSYQKTCSHLPEGE